MADQWNYEDFPKLKLFFLLLALVIKSLCVTGDSAEIQLLGKIGGSVSFHCPVEPKKVKMLYLQRGESFVNGFFVSKNMSGHQWQNTQMDEKNRIVKMHSLNVSHEGTYKCIIQYDNEPRTSYPASIHLKVIGDFSEPEIMVLHSDEISWTVMCSSHGGYPFSMMNWNTSGSWKVMNSTKRHDPATLTYNISSTAVFNCTTDEVQSISCSAGDVTSTQLSICTSKPPDLPTSTHFIVIAAIVIIVVFAIISTAVCVKKHKKCRTEGAAPADVRSEQVNGREGPETLHTDEEEIALTIGQDIP